MRVNDLFPGQDVLGNAEIAGISVDSRQVNQGDIFVCLPSLSATQDRSNLYIAQALANGAQAVVAQPQYESGMKAGVVFRAVKDPRKELARLCSVFYKNQPATITAVTGTNGKSSVAHFNFQLWRHLGVECTFLGTIGMHSTQTALVEDSSMHTTPDTLALHKTLARCVAYGVNYVSLEASSHGLDQHRLEGVRLKAAAFTNLSHDHLDYHETFERYFAAKARLFRELLPEEGTAVIHRSGNYAEALIAEVKARGNRLLTVGEVPADIAIKSVCVTETGYQVKVTYEDKDYEFCLPLVGRFQVDNALVAAALVTVTGFAFADVVKALEQLTPVNGRMQRIKGDRVFVDYAHTPDALYTALTALRPHTQGKLWVVFGCGGERDQQKRPLMGETATKLAEHVVVTDDNPRHENPVIIRQHIISGCCDPYIIPDRAEAIAFAIDNKAPEDTVLIAGKGHEKYQLVGDRKLDFDDVAIAEYVVKCKLNRNGLNTSAGLNRI